MKKSPQELESIAKSLRIEILKMITQANSGHPGGSLSALDIILWLYSNEMRFDPKNPHKQDRDRFVLSKGHGVPALYAVLAYYGFFPNSDLRTLRKINSPLQGHPANRLMPAVEASTGSLGQGLSIALGMAFAALIKNKKNPPFNVFVMLGDGEIEEGQVWEASMCAAHYGVHNLMAFIDRNNGQIDGLVDDIMGIEPLIDKFESFGWNTLRINGHNFNEIADAIQEFHKEQKRPTMVIADTIKGKGVSFLEKDTVKWHGKALSQEEIDKAIIELAGEI